LGTASARIHQRRRASRAISTSSIRATRNPGSRVASSDLTAVTASVRDGAAFARPVVVGEGAIAGEDEADGDRGAPAGDGLRPQPAPAIATRATRVAATPVCRSRA